MTDANGCQVIKKPLAIAAKVQRVIDWLEDCNCEVEAERFPGHVIVARLCETENTLHPGHHFYFVDLLVFTCEELARDFDYACCLMIDGEAVEFEEALRQAVFGD